MADKYIIEDPSVLDGKSEKYNVIVTHDHAEAIYKILDRYGYVFIVEEDKSEFHFTERIELVRKGISNLKNVKVLSSGEFIISSITFPEYFDKDEKQSLKLDLSKDVNVFGKYIVTDVTYEFLKEDFHVKVEACV